MADAPPGLAGLMADHALPDAARVVGYHIATHDTGEGVEMRHEVVAALLHGWPGEDKVRATLRVLRLAGYAERRPGGRDHGDTYHWTGDRVGVQPHSKDRVGMEPHPKSDIESGSGPTLSDSVGVQPHSKLHDVVVDDGVVDVEGVAHAHAKRYGLDPRVRDLLDNPTEDAPPLNGCRGAIVDYLEGRVMGPGQVGYVRSIQAWLRGGSGTPRGRYGGLLDVRDPIHLIATGLNDLLTEDETKYRSGRGQVGVIATLRTKLSVLIDHELAPRHQPGSKADAGATDPTPPPRRTPRVHIES